MFFLEIIFNFEYSYEKWSGNYINPDKLQWSLKKHETNESNEYKFKQN